MHSKKRITRVRFTDASRTAHQPSTPPTTYRAASQRSIPQVILAPQVLPKFQLQHRQPKVLTSVPA